VLTDIIWRITVSWEAGYIACKLIKFTQCLTTYASTYVLVALSIDRYDAIKHPMNFSGSWKRAKILVVSAWLLSALFSTPQIFLYELAEVQGEYYSDIKALLSASQAAMKISSTPFSGRTQCWIDLGEAWCWQVYMTLVALVLFILPALIISLCYAIIVKTIWENGTYLGASRNFRGKQQSKGAHDDEDERESRRASSRGIIPKAKVKTIKMTFVIVIVFILCWSPYIVFDLLQVFDQIPRTQTNLAVATFIQSLAPLNSAANPLIYCMFSAQISKNLR
jgi:neuropeptide S receptor 1